MIEQHSCKKGMSTAMFLMAASVLHFHGPLAAGHPSWLLPDDSVRGRRREGRSLKLVRPPGLEPGTCG